MTRRGQPPRGLPGPRRGRPALRSDPGHHHGALAERWPQRLFHLGEPRMGEHPMTQVMLGEDQKEKQPGQSCSAAAPTAAGEIRRPHTPTKGCHPPTRGCQQSPGILGHHGCNDHVLLLLHGPRRHRSLNKGRNAPTAEGDCVGGRCHVMGPHSIPL